MVRFLADESCDFSVVRALRRSGYNVLAVSEVFPRVEDSDVLNVAFREERIVLTEDKDFGQLVFAHGKRSSGVIFLRYPARSRRDISQKVLKLVKQYKEKLARSFVVVQPGRTRVIRTPES